MKNINTNIDIIYKRMYIKMLLFNVAFNLI